MKVDFNNTILVADRGDIGRCNRDHVHKFTSFHEKERETMADMQLLKAKLKYSDLTYQTAGEIIGGGRDTFYRKMQEDGAGFTVEEIRKLMDVMQLNKEDV